MARRRTPDVLDRPATTEEREALLAAVHGSPLACFRCGAAIPATTPPSAAITSRSGDVRAWSACPDCASDVAQGSTAGAVLRVLELPIDMTNLAAASRVVLRPYSSTWDAAPGRPATRPWAHIDRDGLLREYQDAARDEARLMLPTPCQLCGLTRHPQGPGADGLCRGCHDRKGIALSTRICTVEDLASANLAGLASPTGWPLHPGLAGLLGFTAYFWAEGAHPDLDTPFNYVDIAVIQARAKALADDGVLRLPARWPLPIQPW